MNRAWMIGALAALSGAALLGCSDSDGTRPEGRLNPVFASKAQQTLAPLADCTALREQVTQALTLEYTTGFWNGGPCWSCPEPLPFVGAPARAAPAGERAAPAEFDAGAPQPVSQPGAQSPGSRRVNDTNTQEEGVDEADLIEASPDGSTLYVLRQADFGSGGEVLVVDASDPANTAIRARIAIDNGRYARGIYLDSDNARLLVLTEAGFFFAGHSVAVDSAFAPPPDSSETGSQVLAFDVSDPGAPSELGRYTTDAQIIDSRRIGDRLHLVSQFGIPLPSPLRGDEDFFRLVYEDYAQALRDGDETATEQLGAQIAARIETAVAQTPLAELLPANNGELLDCTAVHAPEVPQRLGLIQISSMRSDTFDPRSVALLNNGWQVYGSVDNLYVAQTSAGWWLDPAQVQQTAVHRFALDANGPPRYAGSGLVEGWAANRYQYSEHAGHLRVATTLRGSALLGPESELRLANRLSVLELAETGLEEVGRSPLYGPNEDIRAARFFGDRGYVVTFEFTDPLFAFDLSEPSNPRIVGELEIPGFSTYIHPLGADRLLTIGRAGGAGGQGVGNRFQLQIFDVSGAFDADPSTGLVQVTTAEPDVAEDAWAFSLAEYDPLAFAFLDEAGEPRRGTLSLPVQVGSPRAEEAFSGFYVYEIDGVAGEINQTLALDHAQREPDQGDGCPPQRDPTGVPCQSFAPVIYNEPLRTKIVESGPGVVIPVPVTAGDTSYFTLSRRFLHVDDAEGNRLATVNLEPETEGQP